MKIPILNPEDGYLRLKIELAYDGTRYAGWAKQPNQLTIQAEIESAIFKVTRNRSSTVVAGRTDAGVHAAHQIIHLDLPSDAAVSRYRPDENRWEIGNLAFRLNQILDEDIRILKVEVASQDFHARYSALSREYTYKILDGGRQIPPLQRFGVAPWYRELDLDLLNEVCAQLLGEHDFAAFCKFREASTTIRNLQEFSWQRDNIGFLVARIRADAFCYSMIRNLVGAAVCVGEKRFPAQWMLDIFTAKSRVSDSYVFPARGLTLVKIEYPDEDGLRNRALLTANRRDDKRSS